MTVFDALRTMAEKDIGAVPVLDGKELVGIFSERDYARKVILKGKASKDVHVRDIMSTHLITVTPDQVVSNRLVQALLDCDGLIYIRGGHSDRSFWDQRQA